MSDLFTALKEAGAIASDNDAHAERDAVNKVIVSNADLGVNRERDSHDTEIVRRRIPKSRNRSGYGYEYGWICTCDAKSKRTWRYGEIRWPARFIFSTAKPPKWQSERMDHTSARESACDHRRNITHGPNRGKKSRSEVHAKPVCAFYCGGNLASRNVEGVPACESCAEEVRQ